MISSTDRVFYLCNSLLINVSESSILRKRDSLKIDLDLDIKCFSVGADQSLALTPVLIEDSCHQELPAIIVCGEDRFKAYRKWIMLSKFLLFKSDYNIYAVIRAKNGKSVSVSYKFKIPTQTKNSNATLGFYDHLEGQVKTMRNTRILS